jgi:hypothetical protein
MKKVLVVFLLFLVFSCKKEESVTNHPVPSVPLSLRVYPNDPLNFKIQAIGGWMYFPGGLRGLIIYRKSTEEFVVIERTSSQLPEDDKAIAQVSSDNFTLRDTISDSSWRIVDGGVIKGPAGWPLRLYANNYDGNTLFINN